MEGGKAVNGRKRSGDRGEAEVAKYLRKKGYTLLASQWRCRFGELDLVAQSRRGHICFVEVKLRSEGAIGLPREFVDAKKRERLRRAASAYLARYELDIPAQFDVAEVYVLADGTLRIEYLENAFE